MVARAQRSGGVEWITLGLFVGFYGAWLVVILDHESIPWPASIAALALLGGFYMSLQHEALHGHPTGWRGVNTALAFAPLSFWLPYLGYRSSHMVHHH
ncbi:MAG: fatty acid desaturase, partial [Ilumatobacteraceae bacterium]